jgi:hypothetical protein
LPFYFSEDADLEKRFPVISFRQVLTTTETRLIREPHQVDMDGGELVSTAIQNLTQLPISWSKSKFAHCLIAENMEYGSEKILDKLFLLQAIQQLDCHKIAVAAPCKGIIICANAEDPAAFAELNQEVARFHQDAFRIPLSDVLFFYDAHATLQSAKKVATNIQDRMKQAPIDTTLPENIHVQFVSMPVFTGDYYYKCVVSQTSEAAPLTEGLYKAILQVLTDYGKDSHYLGIIEIQTDHNTIKKTTELDEEVAAFMQRLTQLAAIKDFAKRMKKHIEISFLFGEDFNSGNGHLKKVIRVLP